MDRIYQKLRNLDAYPKINEDFYSRTLSGGLITLISSVLILFLFFSELGLYLHKVTETKLLVDTSRGQSLRINFDVTFPAIRCSLLSVDAIDISGEQHLDIRHDISKKRINAHGDVIEVRQEGIGAPKIDRPLQRHGGRLGHDEEYCGSCFGGEMSDDDCCNTCEEVREAYRRKGWAMTNMDLIDQCKREGFIQMIKDEEGEGCNINGSLEVNRVAGSFHFAPWKSFHQTNFLIQDLLDLQKDSYNISHRINRLAFGDNFPGVVNPLAGIQLMHDTPNGVQQFFIKVVPTIYTDIRGRTVHSNQYSVTEHFKKSELTPLDSLPGVYFFYDFSPIKVIFKEEHISFLHFMTSVCAIIGGIFTIAGIIDSFIYHGQRAIKKKVGIGKFG
ncbi:endoplasmic reticulum-Golgi intermediate compartment protein 3-like isoform X2 [Populus alba x Populus x berolinensis]|uniref:Endoplasmic reticulum-Golgi intermediate compartment protein 3-like isoform X2 n=1 Tax=Populus alba x Populus x berolinensis TaxID=444605 RepID=A0AAD6R6V3_9ROSI|nr:endoplasmic reticulum-Golgi intermediate compartment protein 3-like isoform X2 [Populus alba x Populus x berolinensis]KAJ7002757.1 endoplasmic reticulum-Golgi intermediate compartment protein 3-like isoform X2 [Populus alba x Populus x berolinensis]